MDIFYDKQFIEIELHEMRLKLLSFYADKKSILDCLVKAFAPFQSFEVFYRIATVTHCSPV